MCRPDVMLLGNTVAVDTVDGNPIGSFFVDSYVAF